MKNSQLLIALLTAILITASSVMAYAQNKKVDVPDGYGEAAQAGEQSDKPKKIKSDGKLENADVPAGYENTEQAGKPQKKKRPVKVVPAIPKPIADQAPANAEDLIKKNPQLKALADQMQAQLKPFFAAELTFAKHVCQADEVQFKKMKSLVNQEYDKAVQHFAIKQAPQMGIPIDGKRVRAQRNHTINIYEKFEEAAGRIVKQVFPKETVQIYQQEQDQRRLFRARSGAMLLVAHLDTQFRLSSEQREKLTDSLQQVWRRDWEQYMQIMSNNPQFFPPVPDNSITPHLNKSQRKRWQGMQKHQIGMHWNNIQNHGHFRNLKPEIEWFDEQAPQKAQGVFQFLEGGIVQLEAVAVEALDAAEEADE